MNRECRERACAWGGANGRRRRARSRGLALRNPLAHKRMLLVRLGRAAAAVLARVKAALHPLQRLVRRQAVQLRQQAGAHHSGPAAPAPAAGGGGSNRRGCVRHAAGSEHACVPCQHLEPNSAARRSWAEAQLPATHQCTYRVWPCSSRPVRSASSSRSLRQGQGSMPSG